jgi:hypothetical protein
LQFTHNRGSQWNFTSACACFWRTEVAFVASLCHAQCPAKQIDSSPAQREDFTDPQAGHCRKNNDHAERFVTRSYESSNFFCRKKPVRTLQRPFWHLDTAHWIIQDVVPIDSRSHHFAEEMSQMVGGFPCESLLEFLQEVLLNFDSGDVTQAMSTKPWNQVFAQQERINLPRRILECWQYSGLKAVRDELQKQHRAFWTVLPLVNGAEMSV